VIKHFNKNLPAFSLLEVLIVTTIFFAIAIITLPFSIGQLQESRSDAVLKDLRSALFLIEQDAYTRKNNSAYGIAFFSDHYIEFSGPSLATATEQNSVSVTGSTRFSDYSFGGSNEVNFVAGSFRPTSSGSVVISDGKNSYRLSVSSQGLISYTIL